MSKIPDKKFKKKNSRDSELTRIDKKYLYNEIQSLLNLEKGFFLTVKNLLLKPGKTVREFLFKNRIRYVKPIIFLIFVSLSFSALVDFLDIEFSFFNIDRIEGLKGKLKTKEIGNWTQENLGYSQLIMAVFIGFWTKLFFRKANYNLYEILVLLSFIFGEAFIIFGVFIFLAGIFDNGILAGIGGLAYFLYIIWATGQFFGEKKIMNYLKSVLVYAFGSISYMIALMLLGFLLKLI